MSAIRNIILRSMLAVGIAACIISCKKDDDASSVFTFAQTTYVFEAGQTQSAGFTSRNAGRIEISEAPDGWTVTLNKSSVSITAPAVVNDSNESGTVELKAHGNTTITVKLNVSVQAAEDLSTQGTANCYIAPRKNTRYKFKATVRGNNPASVISPAKAELIWQSAKNLINYIVFDGGYIMFSTSSSDTFGNGVIAAVDENNTILWSWHIWFTDYDPESSAETYSDDMTFMDRNLGADGSSTVSEAWKSSGLLYQWGRKDPFVGSKSYKSDVSKSTYDAAGKWQDFLIEQTTETKGTVEYAVTNPRSFLTGIRATDFDWLYAGHDNTLWGSEAKSIYDPCPYGWQVPPQNAWKNFTVSGSESEQEADFNVDGAYSDGWIFRYDDALHTTFYPAAGRRSFSAGVFSNVDLQGYDPIGVYWSSAVSNAESYALLFTKDMINPAAALYRAAGNSIRCVKNTAER